MSLFFLVIVILCCLTTSGFFFSRKNPHQRSVTSQAVPNADGAHTQTLANVMNASVFLDKTPHNKLINGAYSLIYSDLERSVVKTSGDVRSAVETELRGKDPSLVKLALYDFKHGDMFLHDYEMEMEVDFKIADFKKEQLRNPSQVCDFFCSTAACSVLLCCAFVALSHVELQHSFHSAFATLLWRLCRAFVELWSAFEALS
jgi:hypothetical protein